MAAAEATTAARSVAERASAELRARWDGGAAGAAAGRGESGGDGGGGGWRAGEGGALCSRRGSSGPSIGSLGDGAEEEEQERGRGRRKQRRVRRKHRRSMAGKIPRERKRRSSRLKMKIEG